MVVALHLVVEDLALLRSGVGDQLSLDDLEDIVADVRQFRLDLGLVVADQGQLVALYRGGNWERNGPSETKKTGHLTFKGKRKVATTALQRKAR